MSAEIDSKRRRFTLSLDTWAVLLALALAAAVRLHILKAVPW
jgi:hypothetical protein